VRHDVFVEFRDVGAAFEHPARSHLTLATEDAEPKVDDRGRRLAVERAERIGDEIELGKGIVDAVDLLIEIDRNGGLNRDRTELLARGCRALRRPPRFGIRRCRRPIPCVPSVSISLYRGRAC
jgi:hypothetical protein